jgi:hypothetical protein
MLAIAVGYLSIAALNSFVHVIISVYFKTELFLTGISQMPSEVWVYGVTALQFAFGLFGGLLTTTLAGAKAYVEVLGFILLMIVIGFVDYSVLNGREPLWYLITSPILKALGIFIGYRLIKQQNTNRKTAG